MGRFRVAVLAKVAVRGGVGASFDEGFDGSNLKSIAVKDRFLAHWRFR